MDHNYYANYNRRVQPQAGRMAAFLLGVGPMPPPRPEDVAVAVANRMIDSLDGQGHQFDDNNIDPRLQLQANDPGTSYFLSLGSSNSILIEV
jgi:hypothetical protein